MKQPAMGIPVPVSPYEIDPLLSTPQCQEEQEAAAVVGEFSTGLFDCHTDDVSLCCLTCWCPCITFGRIAEIVDRGSLPWAVSGAFYTLIMFSTGYHWIYSCTYRSKLRAQYGMQKSHLKDFCTHLFCEPCALCQEYRELQYRGYDPELGWDENMDRQNAGMMPPSMPEGMNR